MHTREKLKFVYDVLNEVFSLDEQYDIAKRLAINLGYELSVTDDQEDEIPDALEEVHTRLDNLEMMVLLLKEKISPDPDEDEEQPVKETRVLSLTTAGKLPEQVMCNGVAYQLDDPGGLAVFEGLRMKIENMKEQPDFVTVNDKLYSPVGAPDANKDHKEDQCSSSPEDTQPSDVQGSSD